MHAWIDFRQLRQNLSFEAVLRHYGVEIKHKGKNQHLGFCPLPNHQGQKRSQSFSANLEKGVFQCFGCGAKGNLLEFAALMEEVDPSNGKELREVAINLQERFCPGLTSGTSGQKPEPKQKKEAPVQPSENLPVLINAPLDFQLKDLDARHSYLLGRGFTLETIAHFGLGVASRGSLKGRVAIPLHDHEGKLVGYAGRVVDDATIREDNPKYRFPSKRKRNGTLYEFHKSLFLYNAHQIKEPVDNLVVVEGFPSVWWLHQNGVPHVVATMGSDCSERQAELVAKLVKPDGRVWLFPDGDAAGEKFAQSFLLKAAQHRFTRWVKLGVNQQPTAFTAGELQKFLPEK